MREDITSAENSLVYNENEAIHQAGYRSLFIPYWNATGQDVDNDFDCRIVQPSYAFRSILDGGLVDKDRLFNAFNHTAGAHEGMEIEFRGQCDLIPEKYIARKYLEYGAQLKVTAAFLGAGLDKFDEDVYDAIVKWLDGYNINSQEDWITNTGKGETTVTTYPIPHTLFLQHDEVHRDQSVIASVDHKPVSWAVVAGEDSLRKMAQGYYLPLPEGITPSQTIDLKLFQYDKNIPLGLMLVGSDSLPNYVHNDLIGSHIEVTNQAVDTANYHDVQYTGVIQSGKLNDGKISKQWSDGGVVGWNSNPGRVVISFDFGSAKKIAGFRIYCNQDNQAGIQYPLNPVMLMTSKPRITVTSALGSVSPVINAVGIYSSDLTQNEGSTVYQGSGYYAKTGLDVTTRYASLLFSTNGWAMISEIEFYDDQGNKIPFSYELLRHTGNQSLYQDDGLRLADGQYIDGYASGGITALNNNLTNTITMSHDPVLLNQIDIYSMEDPRYQIVIPKELEVWLHTPGDQLLQMPKPSISKFGRYGVKLTTKFPEINADRVIIKDYGDGNWHAFTEIAGNDTKHE